MGVENRPDGSDRHMLANHYGPYLLTRLMIPLMHRGSRIVNISSRAHYAGSLAIDGGKVLDDQPSSSGGAGSASGLGSWWSGPLWLRQYSRSKLCNVLFTQQLQQRLKDRGISAFSVSPGFVNTSIFNNVPSVLRSLMRPLINTIALTPAQGARTGIYAALSPELKDRNALFLHDCKEKEPSALAGDVVLGQRLWDASEKFVKISQINDQAYF